MGTKNLSCWELIIRFSVVTIRWRLKRGFERVPDESGALPAHPLPARHLRAHHLGGEGFPRVPLRLRTHQRLLRTRRAARQVRPQDRQVHVLLSPLPRGRRTERRQRRHRSHQIKKISPVRRLVPNRYSIYQTYLNCTQSRIILGITLHRGAIEKS